MIPSSEDAALLLLRKRFQRLAADADSLRHVADLAAERTLLPENAPIFLEALSRHRLLYSMCGALCVQRHERDARGGGELYALKDLLSLFWNAVRAFVSIQHSGFSLDGQKASLDILSSVVRSKPEARTFWTHEEPEFSRMYAAMSTCLSVLPVIEPWHRSNRSSSTPRALLRELFGAAAIRWNRPTTNQREEIENLALIKLNRNLQESARTILSRMPQFPTDLQGPVGDEELGDSTVSDLSKKLFSALERLLRRGKIDSSVSEIAELVRVLGGRFLNPKLSLSPDWRSCLGEALDYVLEKQNHDGAWSIPAEEGPDQDVLAARYRYSPLLYLMDLPSDVLRARIEPLASAAERAVRELLPRIENYQLQQRFVGDEDRGPDQPWKVASMIFDGFMVGIAVGDRFRDLLSDEVRDALGARDPSAKIEWESFPNTLKIRENLYKGAITLWQKRSSQRPGAILLYGPPGTGKTTIVQGLANMLNEKLGNSPGEGGPDRKWKFLVFSPAAFAKDGSDRIVARAEEIFEQLQQVRRCVVLLDEMEEFLRSRGPESTETSRLITTAFLPLLQEAVQKREIVLVVATNFVATVDSAVTRRGRFDLILPFGPPNKPAREKIVDKAFASESGTLGLPSVAIGDASIEQMKEEIVRYTMGYTTPEIEDFLRELGHVFGLDDKITNRKITNRATLIMELWRIRQERVPTALSGRVGCNWHAFQDEAARYRRFAADVNEKDEDDEDAYDPNYWDEPPLPPSTDRN